jgi:hypothetical protein
LFPVVQALQSMRGVSMIVAATTVAEVGDLKRFQNPAELMSYLGLVPSEHSSGQKTKRGSITKAGNGHVRRVLSRQPGPTGYRPGSAGHCSNDKKACHNPFASIAWKAQLRLCSRYRRLWAKGKVKPVIVTAIARELCGIHVGHRQRNRSPGKRYNQTNNQGAIGKRRTSKTRKSITFQGSHRGATTVRRTLENPIG